MKPSSSRFSKTCIAVILLWIFIFSFLGIVFKTLSAHDSNIELNNAPEIRINTESITPQPDVIKPTDKPVSDPAHVVDPNAIPIIASGKSKFAYVTLMHGIDKDLKYRGFLFNALLAKQSLQKLGSLADFIVLVGFTYGVDPENEVINKDIQLLRDNGIIVYYLPRLLNEDDKKRKSIDPIKVNFNEMALLKITPFNFLEYERIQFLDGDVLPYKNMDCLFLLDRVTANTGSASPVNSGWYLAIPNHHDYVEMKKLATYRLTHKWDEIRGWGKEIPQNALQFRGTTKYVKKWDFNGASLDQGLLTHYFVLNSGRIQLLDMQFARIYEANFSVVEDSVKKVLSVCDSSPLPTSMFYHFTGRSKPWLQDLRNPKEAGLKLWAKLLDGLGTEYTSQNIHEKPLTPPLGYFAPNK